MVDDGWRSLWCPIPSAWRLPDEPDLPPPNNLILIWAESRRLCHETQWSTRGSDMTQMCSCVWTQLEWIGWWNNARATLLLSSRLLRPRSSFPSLAPLSRWRTTDAIPTQMTYKTPDLMKRRILPYILFKHWLFEQSQTSFCPHWCVSHLFGVYVY